MPRLVVWVLLLASPALGSGLLKLQSGAFDPLLQPAVRAQSRYHIVQLLAPMTAPLLERLRSELGPPLMYLPEDAYLFRLDPSGAGRAAALPEVRWVGPFLPRYKQAPGLLRVPAEARDVLASIFVLPGESASRVAEVARRLGCTILRVRDDRLSRRVLARVPPEAVDGLASLDAVSWIEQAGQPSLRNGPTAWVLQSNVQGSTPLWSRGLHGENQIVGHIDYPIDLKHCMFSDTVPPGPDHLKVVGFRVQDNVPDGHGTHTAGSIAGRYLVGLGSPGMAHAARLSHTDLHLIAGFANNTSNLDEMLLSAHQDGARIHSNSWGDDSNNLYNSLARDVDAFSRDNEEDLVVFAATNLPELRTPENAKSVLAVGASQQAPGQDNPCSGGIGPTSDGRLKPEVFAPGCNTVSASPLTECGLTSKTGTSMACAVVAGGAALVRQYFTDGFYPSGEARAEDSLVPSGALLRAVLVHAAQDMPGIPGYPSDREGWGRLLLDAVLYFEGDAGTLLLRDVRNADGLSTGQTSELCFEVRSAAAPLHLTMSFTDVPGELNAAEAAVNDLDLELIGPKGVYLGNALAGGESQTDGAPDPRNSVERILLLSPAPGPYTVRVRGTAVRMETQGYSLVLTGDLREAPRLAAPGSVAASAGTDGQIRLSWDPVEGASSYRVLRSPLDCEAPMELVDTSSTPGYLDESVSGGVAYSYRLEALGDDCQRAGLRSACATASTGGPCTLAPAFAGATGVVDKAFTECALQVEWDQAHGFCGAATGYNVYRSTDPSFVPGPENLVLPCQTVPGFLDRYGLESGMPMYYLVRAEDPSIPGPGPCGGTEDGNTERVGASPHGEGTALETYLETFEDGARGWSSQGSSLWHLAAASGCVPPGYASATHAWYFGQDSTCNYDTGAAAQGTLASPALGPIGAGAELSFSYFRQVEEYLGSGEIDVTSVNVQPEGGTATEVWRQSSSDPPQAGWRDSGPISLGAFEGATVRLHFVFRSGDADNNGFAGWAVDDVRVSAIVGRTACQRIEMPRLRENGGTALGLSVLAAACAMAFGRRRRQRA